MVSINDPRALDSYIRLAHDGGDRRIQEQAVKGIVEIYVTPETGFTAGVKKVVDFMNPLSDGYNPLMVEGHADNIKITRPEDLPLAAYYLARQAAESAVTVGSACGVSSCNSSEDSC